jgi:hypothetical protein
MKPGVSTSGWVETSPAKKRAKQRARKRQEKAWARRSGPVEVRFVDPDELRNPEKRS